jgi:hypothetical protein
MASMRISMFILVALVLLLAYLPAGSATGRSMLDDEPEKLKRIRCLARFTDLFRIVCIGKIDIFRSNEYGSFCEQVVYPIDANEFDTLGLASPLLLKERLHMCPDAIELEDHDEEEEGRECDQDDCECFIRRRRRGVCNLRLKLIKKLKELKP